MDQEDACKVAGWHYGTPYDFYDMASDPEDLEDLLDSERRRNYHAVLSEDELVGFFSFGVEAQVPGGDYADNGDLDVGLGMRPDLTGKGLGLEFLLAGLEFARHRFAPSGFRLSVATFNERAIRVYESAGFQHVKVFTQHTNGGDHAFLLMVRDT